ncbi:MAG: response regulator, partial [Cyanobacteria bacterium P01_F01_bin.86]
MSDPSILIVDDEVSNFDVIETILIHTNYQLNYVDSGLEAVKSLELFQPDLILLDVMMPGMDGITTCQNIKAITRWQSVPIIMITALTTKEDLARCLEAGADDFISKPLHPVELRSRVDYMFRIKKTNYDLKKKQKKTEKIVDMILCDMS